MGDKFDAVNHSYGRHKAAEESDTPWGTLLFVAALFVLVFVVLPAVLGA